LTALALKQGGYDWALLAFAVGFGGSMVWFGSSAGVAVSNMFPEARSVGSWLKHGWFVAVAYVVGFFVMLALWGWYPTDKRERPTQAPAVSVAPSAHDRLARANRPVVREGIVVRETKAARGRNQAARGRSIDAREARVIKGGTAFRSLGMQLQRGVATAA
ncbi:MAG: hypothetical protein ACREUX_13625, partial [Burkholderiales bacterium]